MLTQQRAPQYRRSAATLVAVLLLGACTQTAAPAASTEPMNETELGEALRTGGYVLFVRHTASDTGIDQGAPPQVTDCGRQRNLSQLGREQAERMGAAIQRAGIAVGDVLASPFCRTVDTARLAFGEHTVDDRLLQGEGEEAAARLAELLSDPPARGNRVLVGHVGNLGAAADLHIGEGDTAVFAPQGDAGFTLVGTVPVDGWSDLEARATSRRRRSRARPGGRHA